MVINNDQSFIVFIKIEIIILRFWYAMSKVFKAVRRGEAQLPRRAKASLKQGDGEPPCRLGDA